MASRSCPGQANREPVLICGKQTSGYYPEGPHPCQERQLIRLGANRQRLWRRTVGSILPGKILQRPVHDGESKQQALFCRYHQHPVYKSVEEVHRFLLPTHPLWCRPPCFAQKISGAFPMKLFAAGGGLKLRAHELLRSAVTIRWMAISSRP